MVQKSHAICLDTRVLSQYLNHKKKAKEIINEFQDKEYEIYTTTINISEFFMGLYKIRDVGQTRLEELERFFKALHPRSLSYSSAVYAGKLYGTILKGNAIGWRDTFIASIVKENGNEIITGNALHFSRVPNLKVVEY